MPEGAQPSDEAGRTPARRSNMDKIKELFGVVFGSSLIVEGSGRTYAKVPMWVVVLAALASLRPVIITAILVVAFGMRVRIVKN